MVSVRVWAVFWLPRKQIAGAKLPSATVRFRPMSPCRYFNDTLRLCSFCFSELVAGKKSWFVPFYFAPISVYRAQQQAVTRNSLMLSWQVDFPAKEALYEPIKTSTRAHGRLSKTSLPPWEKLFLHGMYIDASTGNISGQLWASLFPFVELKRRPMTVISHNSLVARGVAENLRPDFIA